MILCRSDMCNTVINGETLGPLKRVQTGLLSAVSDGICHL